MLRKLLKYDLRAMWKQFSLIWGAALVLGLANRFFIGGRLSQSSAAHVMPMLLVAVFMAMFVISAIFVIQRFGKGLLGDEGYLMHTLPVWPWQLVASKLICAVVTCAGSCAAASLSLFLMAPLHWYDFLQFPWARLFQGLAEHPDTVVVVLEFFLLLLSFAVLSIAMIYLSISIGHLFPRRRGLISAAAFVGLYTLVNCVGVFFLDRTRFLWEALGRSAHATLLITSAGMLLPAAVLLAAVCWILQNKLNLE